MIEFMVRSGVRGKFAATSRERARTQIWSNADKYLALGRQLSPEAGSRVVTVPKMTGVDEEMRNWSFFMLLKHHVIVNGVICQIVEALVRGEEPKGVERMDPRRDVLPGSDAGEELVQRFEDSVNDYLAMEKGLPVLRGTKERPHPVFGLFDAHKWHCMFGFHLFVHFKQAKLVYSGAVGD
ncbi:MAG: hypothetical protein AAGD22_17430 [Verrucomicrobiota bacterium]